MEVELLTKEDLRAFKKELLEELKQFVVQPKQAVLKPWLKNTEIKKLLGVSSNTLQRLRISGKLKSTKVGGVHYYRYEDLEAMFEKGS